MAENPRTFRLQAETLEKLQAIADKELRTLNWLIQVAADALIDQYKRKGPKAFKEAK